MSEIVGSARGMKRTEWLMLMIALAVVAWPSQALAQCTAPTAHYAFDLSGNRGFDKSGNGNHGTKVAAQIQLGVLGGALLHDPTDDAQEFTGPDDSSLDITGPVSGIAWIRPNGSHTPDDSPPNCTQGTIFTKGGNYWFQVDQANDSLWFQNTYSGLDFVNVPTKNLISTNTWTQVAFVRNASNFVQFYVNGLPIGGGGLSETPVANSAFVSVGDGNSSSPGACEFNGGIDEIQIFSCELSKDEVLAEYKEVFELAHANDTAPCILAPSGLISRWPLDDATGAGAEDIGGFNNDGTQVDGPTQTSGVVRQALDFGDDGYVEVPDNASLDMGTGDFSIEGWVKPDALPGALVSKYDEGTQTGFTLFFDWPLGAEYVVPRFFLRDGSGLEGIYSLQELQGGEWVHVAVTVDRQSAEMTLYIDGQPFETADTPAGSIDNNAPLWIGHETSFGAFAQLIAADEVAIYNRVLSAPEVEGIYCAGVSGKCFPAGGPPLIVPALTLGGGVVLGLLMTAVVGLQHWVRRSR